MNMSNFILTIGSGSIYIGAALLSYLRDVYCVGKTAFSFYKKPGKKLQKHRVSALLNHLHDIYCVGKTAFSAPYAKRTGRKIKKAGFLWGLVKWLGNKLAYPRSACRVGLRRISALLSDFYKLGRLNQSIIVGCSLLIAVAATLPAWFIHWQNNLGQAGQYSEIRPYSTPENSIAGKPIALSIPSLHIDLPVIDGRYDPNAHNWTLTNDNVQYMVNSAKPNNKGGKTFIYGHALRSIFGRLPYIQPGAELSLITNNGYRFNYQFKSSFATSPSDLSVLNNTKQPVLYVQTCSGTFYQYRQIFSFKYLGYEKV